MAQALLQSQQSPLTQVLMMAETTVRIQCTVLKHQVVAIVLWTVSLHTDQLKLLIRLSSQFSLYLQLESNSNDLLHFSSSVFCSQ